MSTWLRPRFIGIGVGEYDNGHAPLPAAVTDVERLADLLADQVESDVLRNPTEQQVRDHLTAVQRRHSPQPVILAWSGHARPFNDEVRLLAADSALNVGAGLPLREVILPVADSGTTQLLVVIDVCFAGSGVIGGLQTALDVFRECQPAAHAWAGMLASCGPEQTAVDGLFGRRLRRVLRDGPKDPRSRLLWAPGSAYVSGDAIGEAVQRAMPAGAARQRVVFPRVGCSADLLANPLFDPAAAGPVPAARTVDRILAGQPPGGDLVGRVDAVAIVRSWIGSGVPGLRVLTGPPDSGKSAILTHVVQGAAPDRIGAFVNARGRTAEQVRAALPSRSEMRSRCPVVVVDGLDEAGGHGFAIAEQVLGPLAAEACVVVGTRDVTPRSLLAALDPVEVLDLDAPEQRAGAEKALRAYVHGRLADRLGPAEADRLTDLVLGGAPSFPLAYRLTERLRDRPGDGLRASMRDLLVEDLAALRPAAGREPLPAGITPGALARHLLATLAWSYGAGFPEQEWLVVAEATAPVGVRAGRADLLWLLDELGYLVTQDGAAGVATYRLAHFSLVDQLAGGVRTPDDPRAVAVAVALLGRHRAMIDSGLPGDEPAYLWEYGWRHAADAGDAAMSVLDDLASAAPVLRSRVALAEVERATLLRSAGHRADAVGHLERAVELLGALPEQDHLLAMAGNNLAAAYRDAGRPGPAAEAAGRAVELFRRALSDDPASVADLAGALTNLAVGNAEAGLGRAAVAAGIEAVERYRELAVPGEVAMALTNLGIALRRAGETGAAYEAVREAVHLYRRLPGFAASLAGALLGLCECRLLRDEPAGAYAAAEEAVRLSRECAAHDPVLQPNLAVALTALAECQLELGRLVDSVLSAREALMLFCAAAGREPYFRSRWARALTLYSATLSRAPDDAAFRRAVSSGPYASWGATGRDAALRAHRDRTLALVHPSVSAAHPAGLAEQAAQQAVDLHDRDGIDRTGLAEALRQLALCKLDTDVRAADAFAQRALRLDDTEAAAWATVARIHRNAGRLRPAIEAGTEAVARLRPLVDAQPRQRGVLAAALTNLAVAQRADGRIDEAAAGLDEAAALRRRLARGRSGLPQLAASLDRLATIRLEQPGRAADAVDVAEEAVERHRDLGGPGELALALTRLAWAHLGNDQPGKALTAAAEAVDLWADDPSGPGLADAVFTVGQARLALGGSA